MNTQISNNFIKFNDWLMESKKQSKKVEYGCVMLYGKVKDWEDRLKIIDEDDIYDDEFHDYGLEHVPHITILYGIHLDESTPDDVKEFIKTFKPLEITVNEISYFSNDNFDVVKYDVPVTDELKMYNELVKTRFPNTQTYPEYHPHMTISYTLPNTAKKYAKKTKPFKVIFDTVVYSYKKNANDKDRALIKIKIKLK